MGEICSQELATASEGKYATMQKPEIDHRHYDLLPPETADTPVRMLQSPLLDNTRMHTDTRSVLQRNSIPTNPLVVSRIDQPIGPAREILPYNQSFYEQLLEKGTLAEFIYDETQESLSVGCEYRQAQLSAQEQYMGQWKNNQPHGKGILATPFEKYIGCFRDGKKHMHGREISAEEVYQGEFLMGRRVGQGRRFTRTREEDGQYDGDLVKGRIRYIKSGSEYQGELKNGLRHTAAGRFMWLDGTVYQGSFQNDMMCGTGTITYPDGSSYRGEFFNEAKHGKGTFNWPPTASSQKRRYTGDYYQDLKQGKGQYVWSWRRVPSTEGSVAGEVPNHFYQGEFWNDVPHGLGTIQDEKGRRISEFVYGREATEYQQ